MLRRSLFFALVFVLGINQFAQTFSRDVDISEREPSWKSVIGGNVIAPAVETSYGIAVLNDGRMLCACTSSGRILWQKGVKGRTLPYLTAFGDFLYVVTDNKKLNLINPSGLTLWTASCDFTITESPVIGPDGRVFVRGRDKIACFGLNGIKKWQITEPSLSDLPLAVLNDGSVLIYQKQPVNGHTVAKRISPFGENLEDLTFSDIIVTSYSCERGILVALANGSVGLCSVHEEFADSPWVQNTFLASGAFSICYSRRSANTAFFFSTGSNTTVIIINTSTGDIVNQFSIEKINQNALQRTIDTESGFFICDTQTACEFDEDGNIIWTGRLPNKSKWDDVIYTDESYLIICEKNWILESYKMVKFPSSSSKIKVHRRPESIVKTEKISKSEEALGLRPITNDDLVRLIKVLQDGGYGADEKKYLTNILSEAKNYVNALSQVERNTKESSTYFEQNPGYTKNLLTVMSLIGSQEFAEVFADLLILEKNPGMRPLIISYAGKFAYDCDGKILAALEYLLTNKVLPSDKACLKNICDATYEICRFMGRPALFNKGREIISRMFFPQYDKEIRAYARTTLGNLMEIHK